jgi:hypothetical protein
MSQKYSKNALELNKKANSIGVSPKIDAKKPSLGAKSKPPISNKPISTPSVEVDNDNAMGYSAYSGDKFMFYDNNEGESIKVALRVRPMNNLELSRGDENCIKILNETTCQTSIKYLQSKLHIIL